MHINQRTLAKPVSCTGVGMHSGKTVCVTIKPAPVNHGVKFVRTDLPNNPIISAHFHSVVDTSLATVIGSDGIIVSTIEHLMAALAGLSIDNALVEMDDYEVPIMDGSAGPFTALINSGGIAEQNRPRCFFVISEPIELKESDRKVGIYPAHSMRITYTIEFDHPLVKEQSYSLEMSDTLFEREISRARTFGFMHDVEYLKRYGFAQGGSLDNAIVIDKDQILNNEGLRYQNEFVRHKILDCIGDFSLLGMPVLGHVVAYKSGHGFNHAFLEKFFKEKGSWETRTISETKDLSNLVPLQSKSLAI